MVSAPVCAQGANPPSETNSAESDYITLQQLMNNIDCSVLCVVPKISTRTEPVSRPIRKTGYKYKLKKTVCVWIDCVSKYSHFERATQSQLRDQKERPTRGADDELADSGCTARKRLDM